MEGRGESTCAHTHLRTSKQTRLAASLLVNVLEHEANEHEGLALLQPQPCHEGHKGVVEEVEVWGVDGAALEDLQIGVGKLVELGHVVDVGPKVEAARSWRGRAFADEPLQCWWHKGVGVCGLHLAAASESKVSLNHGIGGAEAHDSRPRAEYDIVHSLHT